MLLLNNKINNMKVLVIIGLIILILRMLVQAKLVITDKLYSKYYDVIGKITIVSIMIWSVISDFYGLNILLEKCFEL